MHPLLAALYVATLQFAAGSLLAIVLTEWRAEVTAGFLRFAAVVTLAGAGLAYLLVGGAEAAERACALVLLLLTLAYTLLQLGRTRALRRAVGGFGTAVGLAALILAAGARPSPLLGTGWTALASLASAVALGTSVMALLLGHWYLVDRRLSNRPIAALATWLVAGVAAALVSAALGGARGSAVDQSLSPLLAFPNLTVYLAVGLVLLCGLMASFIRVLVKGNSIQAATGMFYLAVIMALAAEFAAKVYFFPA